MKSIRIGIIAAATALLVGTLGALAAPYNTTQRVDVYSGPNSGQITGAVGADQRVDVSTCQQGWCKIQGARGLTGWVAQQFLVEVPIQQPQPQDPWPGAQNPWPWPQRPHPWPQPQPPRPQPPIYEQAGACFYSERNFRGSSFCLDEGESLNSFRTWDNRIRSVEVFGGARVDLCSDRNLYGNCITLRSDSSRLPRQLDRRASSVDVY